jgi:hypothetical protein
VPIALGRRYFLFVQNDAATSNPATDSYFVNHTVGSFYYGTSELEGATGHGMNDSIGTAQKVASPAGVTSGNIFVDGDIAASGDKDFYEVAVPTGAVRASLVCDAARTGSGLLGFSASLLDASGATTIASVGPEASTPTKQLASPTVNLPAGTTTMYLSVQAAGQDSTNTGTFYHCAIGFSKS